MQFLLILKHDTLNLSHHIKDYKHWSTCGNDNDFICIATYMLACFELTGVKVGRSIITFASLCLVIVSTW